MSLSIGTPWLNPKLIVRESPIAGMGLFAVDRIERAEVCCFLGGTVMTHHEFGNYIVGRDRYSAFAIDDNRSVVQSEDDPATKGNHSCDPNMWLTDALTVVARRLISVGEEATLDYALVTVDPEWSMKCRCQTDLCRGVVTGNDWRLPELQGRYGGHWSPFIEERIDQLAGNA
jgi:hypothetical protein